MMKQRHTSSRGKTVDVAAAENEASVGKRRLNPPIRMYDRLQQREPRKGRQEKSLIRGCLDHSTWLNQTLQESEFISPYGSQSGWTDTDP